MKHIAPACATVLLLCLPLGADEHPPEPDVHEQTLAAIQDLHATAIETNLKLDELQADLQTANELLLVGLSAIAGLTIVRILVTAKANKHPW